MQRGLQPPPQKKAIVIRTGCFQYTLPSCLSLTSHHYMESTQKEGGENASRQKKKQLTRIKHKYNGENPRKNPPPPSSQKDFIFLPSSSSFVSHVCCFSVVAVIVASSQSSLVRLDGREEEGKMERRDDTDAQTQKKKIFDADPHTHTHTHLLLGAHEDGNNYQGVTTLLHPPPPPPAARLFHSRAPL